MEVQDSKLQDKKGFISEKIRFPNEIHNGREIEENFMLTKGDSK
jgi:hypothetical protein